MDSSKNEVGPVRTNAQNITRRAFLVVAFAGLAFAMFLASSFTSGTAMATPAAGVSQTPIASGALAEPITVKFKNEQGGFGNGLDVSSVAIVKNIVAPGGSFGWHQHGGPSWIVVTQGTLTFYDGDDATCTGHPVSAGSAYFDSGDHTHNARNEGTVQAENYVVRTLPAGGATRVDMPAPGTCPF